MKKLCLTLLFLLFSAPVFSQTIATQGIDNQMPVVRDINECWECKMVEGIYTYTFNFVYKMYEVLRPVVFYMILVFLAAWFLWYIGMKILKSEYGNPYDLLKDVFVKIFTVVFVLAMLSMSANTIFKYTIDPIMSFGSGFGKWILVETRNENTLMQDTRVPKFTCDNINLSKNTTDMLRVNGIDTEDDMNSDTLKNIMCVTAEYSNSYTIGIDLGFKIASRGFIGIAEGLSVGFIKNKYGPFLEAAASVNIISNVVVKILLWAIQFFVLLGIFKNAVIVILGLLITICFLYVAFNFLALILDIIVKLAFVGVMMPITIGAWAFGSSDMTNLRKSLSEKLFWGVLRASFRLVMLAVSMGISVFLLNELMVTPFDINGINFSLNDFHSALTSPQSFVENATQFTGFNQNSRDIALLFRGGTDNVIDFFVEGILHGTGVIFAIMMVTMISFMLIKESISTADGFADKLYSGVKDDTILNGLKQLTMSTITYLKNGAKREFDTNMKIEKIKKEQEKFSNKKSQGLPKTSSDIIDNLSVDTLINLYEKQRDNEYIPQTKSEFDASSSTIMPYQSNVLKTSTDIEIENIKSNENKFIKDKFETLDEYKKLTPETKDLLEDLIVYDTPEKLNEISNNNKISEFMNNIDEKTPDIFPMTNEAVKYNPDIPNTPIGKMKEEFIRTEIINLIENDVTDKVFIKNRKEAQELKAFISKSKNVKNKKMQDLYIKFEDEVKSNLKLKAKKLEPLLEDRNTSRKLLKTFNKQKLDAKDVILKIKEDEYKYIQQEIQNLDVENGMKAVLLKRELKHLNASINSIREKDKFELEEEYDSIVKDWKKKKKRRSKINPERKI